MIVLGLLKEKYLFDSASRSLNIINPLLDER